MLKERRITPPFKPIVNRVDDAFYFDSEFTMKTPKGMGARVLEASVCIRQMRCRHLLSVSGMRNAVNCLYFRFSRRATERHRS